MCPILDGYGVMTVLNSEQKLTITDNKWNKIINLHNAWYIENMNVKLLLSS
jgi:hypothetical protein